MIENKITKPSDKCIENLKTCTIDFVFKGLHLLVEDFNKICPVDTNQNQFDLEFSIYVFGLQNIFNPNSSFNKNYGKKNDI